MRLRKSNYAYIQMLWKQSIDQVLADNTVRYWGYFYYLYGLLAEKDTTNALSYTLCDQSIV